MNSVDNEIGKLQGLRVDIDVMMKEQERRVKVQRNLVQCPHCGCLFPLVPESSIGLSLSDHIRVKHKGK